MSAKKPGRPRKTSATFAVIADAMGRDERTISRWARMPGFPETPTVESVRAWAETQGKRTNDLHELKAEKLQQEVEAAKLRNARLRGEMMPTAQMESFVATLAQKWDLLLRQKLEVELGSRCTGKSAAAINAEGTLILDEIRAICERGLNDWRKIGADD